MLIGGDVPASSPWDPSAHVSDVELLALDDEAGPVPNCLRTLRNYTIRADLLVGAALGPGEDRHIRLSYLSTMMTFLTLVGRTPVVCGGQELFVPYHRTCRAYDYKTNTWTETGNFSVPRAGSGFSTHDTWGLIVSGGLDNQ